MAKISLHPKQKEHGRPPSDPGTQRFWETSLHKMLVKGLSHIDGMVVSERIVPAKLAKSCGVCRYTAYRWLGENRISTKGARKVIGIAEGRLTRADFAPYLIV
jgi:hypothetical protein